MQKILVISMIIVIAAALAVPIFADDVISALNSTNNSTNNSSLNESANNSSISNNSTLNNSVNSTLTSAQLQTITETQNKLIALIATISSLKATYGNTKAKGLLNALDQFEKQANRLNDEINAFIKDPSINSTEGIDGRINSFVKREAALEHKVSIKQHLLLKMSDKAVKSKTNLEIKNHAKNQNKNNGKNKNK